MNKQTEDALRMAADNKDQLFECDEKEFKAHIDYVVTHPEYNWRPVKQTKIITRWLWADKDGGITHNLYSDDEARSGFHNSIKTCYPIKLEWSATQFEVEA